MKQREKTQFKVVSYLKVAIRSHACHAHVYHVLIEENGKLMKDDKNKLVGGSLTVFTKYRGEKFMIA